MSTIKTIEIQAEGFFKLLKSKDASMWDLFEQMIHPEEEQLIIFKNGKGEVIAEYILPTTLKRLEEDKRFFAVSFKEKLEGI